MFRHVSQIRDTLSMIIAEIKKMRAKGEDIKLVGFKNRLRKSTCDILIVVEFGDIPMEVQLGL
jgi:hypothetical protein